MKKGRVYYKEAFAGIITETHEGEYLFGYDKEYIKNYPNDFLIFTMPVREEQFSSDRLFPFFDGLIPEGWLLELASKSWKINPNDRMELLIACCQNCIGAVSVIPINDHE